MNDDEKCIAAKKMKKLKQSNGAAAGEGEGGVDLKIGGIYVAIANTKNTTRIHFCVIGLVC